MLLEVVLFSQLVEIIMDLPVFLLSIASWLESAFTVFTLALFSITTHINVYFALTLSKYIGCSFVEWTQNCSS